jgi:NAD(P)H-quinone oxidoreductase subunit 5
MEILTGYLMGWILPAYFVIGVFSNAWLNQRALQVGKTVEGMSWGVFLTLVMAVSLWSYSGSGAIVTTVTDAGLIGFRLDALSGTLALLVSFLGGIILRYSRNYLAGDEQQGHFFKWMALTIGSVLTLVLSPGLVQFSLAWIATSMALHKLLVYYPDRLGTLLSARKKFFISRIGDLLLGLALVGIFKSFGTQDFGTIFAMISGGGAGVIEFPLWISWAIVICAILKSAQFPFHTWLPDTMGAPTPVSALMHAGIINAGGILIVRFSPVLVEATGALNLLALSGFVTLVFASLVMVTQTSVKRALAYSTIAQMGFMILQCGLGAFHLAVLHLVAHSLYKAHSFLSSGTSVSKIKRLASNVEIKTFSLPWYLFSFGMALVISGFFINLFNVSLSDKAGMIVLCTVLCMALTQMIWNQVRQNQVPKLVLSTLAKATGFAGIYYFLAFIAEHLFANSLPRVATHSFVLEAGIGVSLFIFMTCAMLLREESLKQKRREFFAALYVHSLNGFYLNTIVNKTARAIGLVPANR